MICFSPRVSNAIDGVDSEKIEATFAF